MGDVRPIEVTTSGAAAHVEPEGALLGSLGRTEHVDPHAAVEEHDGQVLLEVLEVACEAAWVGVGVAVAENCRGPSWNGSSDADEDVVDDGQFPRV